LQLAGTNASPVWPPTGFGMAALMIFGLRVWPGILLAAFLANLVTLPANTAGFQAATAIGVGNTLELVVAALLIKWLGLSTSPLDRPTDVFRFVLSAGIACAIASIIGT